MMKYTFGILMYAVLALLIGQSSFSQIGENTTSVATPPAKTDDSSQFHRLDKKWSFVIQPLGNGPNPSVSRGVSGGYYLTRDDLIFAEYTSNYSIDTTAYLLDDLQVKSNSIGLHLKHYLGNSFYFRGGLDYRQVDFRVTRRWLFSGREDYQFTGESTAISIAIGNQWQWENFTLGCDWIGYVTPISSNISNEKGTYSDFDTGKKSYKNDYVTGSIYQGLRFYLGMSI